MLWWVIISSSLVEEPCHCCWV